jgi:hypothetical protein
MLETEKCTECEILGAFAKFRKATSALSYLSVPLAIRVGQLSSHCKVIFMKFYICIFFENLSRKLVSLTSDKNDERFT